MTGAWVPIAPPNGRLAVETLRASTAKIFREGGYDAVTLVARTNDGARYHATEPGGERVSISIHHSFNRSFEESFDEYLGRFVAAWHPGLEEVLRYGHLPDGVSFWVSRQPASRSLGEDARAGRSWTALEACDLAAKVCNAIGALHDVDLVHLGVHVDSVMQSARGLVLVDCELGWNAQRSADLRWAQQSGIGARPDDVARYGSPETLAYFFAVGAPSDVFHVGVLLQMLLGEARVVPELAALSQWLCAQDRSARPQHGRDAMRAIEAARARLPESV